MLGSEDDFVRRPESCAVIGLACQSCSSEVARQLVQVSPGMRPSGAITLYRMMFDQPSCRNMEESFLFYYSKFDTHGCHEAPVG